MPDEVNVLIVTQTAIPDALVEPVRQVSPRLRVTARGAPSITERDTAYLDAEVLCTTGDPPTAAQAPRLRWVQAYSAGVEHFFRVDPLILDRVVLTTSSGVHTPQMPEYVLMMILAWAHRLPALMANQAAGEWTGERRSLTAIGELRGATLGVVGYGSIGRESARLAKAFGMRILASKRDPTRRPDSGWCLPGTGDPAGDLPERFYSLDELALMLPECDYVLLALPHTAATHHLLDAQALRAMRPTAVLVNIARGGLVDEPALIEALRSGALRAAALDVFEKEPLPASSPLWSMPNVLLSPHISGFAPGHDARLMALLADNLRRYLAGQKLFNQVEPAIGY